MPIVDNPSDFGKIAAVNAISDIYAMGGTPIMAISILGWPVDKILPEIANSVCEGARFACAEAEIPLAGGHSIDNEEPIFGLAVTGRVDLDHLKRNNGAMEGDLLFLTKSLGVGILTTAEKKGLLQSEHRFIARDNMIKLNKIGMELGKLQCVHAMTDVTGFGLLGHLLEMCEASGTGAVLNMKKVPLLHSDVLMKYIKLDCIPGGTDRNWKSYGHKIAPIPSDEDRLLLCDPQTSGGLLVSVGKDDQKTFFNCIAKENLSLQSIGNIIKQPEELVRVV